MTHRKTLSLFWVVASAAVLALVGCGRSDRQHARANEDDAIWFVHATDPPPVVSTWCLQRTRVIHAALRLFDTD